MNKKENPQQQLPAERTKTIPDRIKMPAQWKKIILECSARTLERFMSHPKIS